MHIKLASTTIAALGLLTAAAHAQTIGFATSPPGAFTHSSGSAVAKVINDVTDLKARVQPGSSTAHRRIIAGEVQFGIGNSFDTYFYRHGLAEYKKTGPQPKLQIAARFTLARVGIFVQKDSPIKTLRDLKGKNVASGFAVQKTIARIITAHLANAELTYDDVKKNPAPNIVRAADDFGSGKNDMLFFAIGSAKVRQVAAKVGGIRAIGIDISPAAIARMQKYLPGAFPVVVKPGKRSPGIVGPTNIIAFDFLIVTSSDVPAATVYTVVKALHGNKKKLVASFKPLVFFKPDNMAKQYKGLEYHAGAQKFYKEVGIWKGK